MWRSLIAALALSLTAVGLANAWWVKGHETIAEAAAKGLPEDVPAYFRAGGKHLAHSAGDPDRWKNPAAKHLRSAESPDHYLDLEDLEGNPLPEDRWKAISLMIKIGKQPERVGMLPYAIMENYDRLACAFYDYRANPNDEAARSKCLTYAGNLSHFTGDLAMPLHTTRDYDGKKGTDGKMIQRGIHAKIDGFPEKNNFSAEEVSRGLKAKKIDDVWTHVVKAIEESHTHVPRCYELDAAGAFDNPTDESRKFIMERCRVGAQLTMDLWYSAWLKSASMPKPY